MNHSDLTDQLKKFEFLYLFQNYYKMNSQAPEQDFTISIANNSIIMRRKSNKIRSNLMGKHVAGPVRSHITGDPNINVGLQIPINTIGTINNAATK